MDVRPIRFRFGKSYNIITVNLKALITRAIRAHEELSRTVVSRANFPQETTGVLRTPASRQEQDKAEACQQRQQEAASR